MGAPRTEGRGFRTGLGLLVGLLLAALAALVLGLSGPPTRYPPPETPAATPARPRAGPPAAPRAAVPAPTGGLLPYRPPGPLLRDPPAAERPNPILSVPAAPDPFRASPAGSPSLVPLHAP